MSQSVTCNAVSANAACIDSVVVQFADAEHIPEAPAQGPITVDNAGERLFLRCERQVSKLWYTPVVSQVSLF